MIDLKLYYNPQDAKELLSEAIDKKEEIEIYWNKFKQSEQRQIWGWLNNQELIGLLGFETNKDLISLSHIAVQKSFRLNGLGRSMVTYLISRYPLYEIMAETDISALGFYHKMGFQIRSLGEKYPGVERFQ